jgi:phosphoribosyl-ATP pyrophosphohydrolase
LKILEESYELVTTKNRVVEEGADVMAHLLMYLNAKGTPIRSIITELNCRANKLREIERLVAENQQKDAEKSKIAYIGVMGSKYIRHLDKAASNLFGLRINRGQNRNLELELTIEDQ